MVWLSSGFDSYPPVYQKEPTAAMFTMFASEVVAAEALAAGVTAVSRKTKPEHISFGKQNLC